MSLPTGIAYDGQDFYIGTLTGLPVPKGAAKVYRINASGVPSAYAGGLRLSSTSPAIQWMAPSPS